MISAYTYFHIKVNSSDFIETASKVFRSDNILLCQVILQVKGSGKKRALCTVGGGSMLPPPGTALHWMG